MGQSFEDFCNSIDEPIEFTKEQIKWLESLPKSDISKIKKCPYKEIKLEYENVPCNNNWYLGISAKPLSSAIIPYIVGQEEYLKENYDLNNYHLYKLDH